MKWDEFLMKIFRPKSIRKSIEERGPEATTQSPDTYKSTAIFTIKPIKAAPVQQKVVKTAKIGQSISSPPASKT